MELLERASALERLHRLLDEIVSGEGRLALVAGEAGIGKTALIQHFCRSASERAEVLVGACDPLSSPTPLGPLLDMAPVLRGEFARLLHDAAPSHRVFGALLDQLVQDARPRVLVIEDLHWADDATLDLLRFLARRISGTRTLLIATYRDDEVGPRHSLRIALGDLATASVARLSIQALSSDAVAVLASGTSLDPRELHRRTGGNPFFVSQVLATPTANVPMTVRDALAARIARISSNARGALEAAAVAGARIETWLVEAIETVAPSGLDACLEAGLLLTDGPYVVFRHELLREAVLELLPATRQIPLHRLVLDALRRAAPRDELLARLAHHAEWAGDRQAVLEFAPAAARRAAQLGAHHEAAAQYARALRWADGLAPRGRALLLEGRGLECYLVDQASEAIDARRAAVQIWHELGDREREGDNLRWLSRTYWLGARNVEAQQASQQALDVLERLSPGESLAYALSNHAQLHWLAGDTLTALAASERAISIARSLGAADALAHAGLSHGAALWSTGDERGRAEIEVILRSSLTTGMHDHAARAYATLVGVHGGNYELDQAERYLARGLEYVVEHDLRVYRHYLQGWQVVLHLRRGRWNEAIESAQRIVTSGEPSIVLHVNALAAIGLVHARRGDPGAWATLDEALELAERIGEPQRLVPVRTARAEAAWLAGDFNRVASEAASLYATAMNRWHGRDADEAMFWLWRAGTLTPTYPEPAARFARQIAGDWAGAAELWRQVGCPYEQACALADGDEVASLRQALTIAQHLGARPLAGRIAGRLRDFGARPASPRPKASPPDAAGPLSSLSKREREVVALVAQGWTNREIAERLVISERTAETHIQRILNRLGLRSRIQIAAWAVQNGVLGS